MYALVHVIYSMKDGIPWNTIVKPVSHTQPCKLNQTKEYYESQKQTDETPARLLAYSINTYKCTDQQLLHLTSSHMNAQLHCYDTLHE